MHEFADVDTIIEEYYEVKHAKPVPLADFSKPPECILSTNACGEKRVEYHY